MRTTKRETLREERGKSPTAAMMAEAHFVKDVFFFTVKNRDFRGDIIRLVAHAKVFVLDVGERFPVGVCCK